MRPLLLALVIALALWINWPYWIAISVISAALTVITVRLASR